MPGPENARTILFALAFFCCQPNAIGEESKALAERLWATRVDNLDAIIGAQFIHRAEKQGFTVSDPYSPDAEEVVQRWSQDPQQDTEVCALRFTDAGMGVYELHGFESATSAAPASSTAPDAPAATPV